MEALLSGGTKKEELQQRLCDPTTAIRCLSNIRAVAQQIYATSASNVQPQLIPPGAWWKEKPAVHRDQLAPRALSSGLKLSCGLERYKTMGRRQPIHITYHPAMHASSASSSERLLDLLEEAGLESSLGREFEAGDHHMMVGALAVVLLVSHEYVKSSRLQRALAKAVSLGKCIIPVLLQRPTPANPDSIFDDPVVGTTLQKLRCIDLTCLLSLPETLGGGAGSAESDGEWNRLIQRLHAATGQAGPRASREGHIFVSYCVRNSEEAAKYGASVDFVGSAWADPRKVKEGLEAKKALSCWVDYENTAFLAEHGLFHGVDSAMQRSKLVLLCMSNEYMASETCCNELQHAITCLKKPVVLLLVGTAESVGRDVRWDKSPLAKLVHGVPYVDMRRCHDALDLEKKLHEIHVQINATLGLEEPEQLPMMRVRVKGIQARNNSLFLNTSLAFFIKFETVGEAHYKCKTHLAHHTPPDPSAEPPPSSSLAGGLQSACCVCTIPCFRCPLGAV